jgi:hypothetical protein
MQRMLISRSCFTWMSKCSHGRQGHYDDLARMESQYHLQICFGPQIHKAATHVVSLVWQVPFKLRDEDIPDDWSCERNIWDREHASCSVPQALTDEEIDEILALQVRLLGAFCICLKSALLRAFRPNSLLLS